jgi:hypothetical protein
MASKRLDATHVGPPAGEAPSVSVNANATWRLIAIEKERAAKIARSSEPLDLQLVRAPTWIDDP